MEKRQKNDNGGQNAMLSRVRHLDNTALSCEAKCLILKRGEQYIHHVSKPDILQRFST